MYTQNIVRGLHRNKRPGLFIKLDIAKAFDSVRWDYLLEVLHAMGFGPRWCGWVSILLSTTSSAVLLNGVRGKWYKHFTGLRQGDPLSPMLFILAMEPLHRLFQAAAAEGLLSPVHLRAASLRMSLYADDAAIFFNPVKEEVQVLADILQMFGQVSRLVTNQSKCVVYPIRCEGFDLEDIMAAFHCPIQSFPCKYLGLPLHVRQLRRVDYQPLIDKLANRLPTWKGRFLNKSGRLNTTGEAKFPECPLLPRVQKIRHSGKKIFPECCTRGREASPSAVESMALGEGWHSGKALFPKCNTQGREALGKENFVFDGGGKRSRMGKIFPETSLFPECLCLALGEASLFPECPAPTLGEGPLPRVLSQGTRGTNFF
jgi:hypothetical protein